MWLRIIIASSLTAVFALPVMAEAKVPAILPDTEVGKIEYHNNIYATTRLFMHRCGRKNGDKWVMMDGKKDIAKVKERRQWTGEVSVGCYILTIRRNTGWFDFKQDDYKINVRPQSQGVLRVSIEPRQYSPEVIIQFISSEPYFGRAY